MPHFTAVLHIHVFRRVALFFSCAGLIAVCLFSPREGYAQLESNRSIARMTVSDGLPGNQIEGISQDEIGFMWFATRNSGLSRFDAHTFKNFRYDPANPNGLASDTLRSVLADGNGRIWVGTLNSGISILDLQTGEFTNIRADSNRAGSLSSNEVRRIGKDAEDRIWIGTSRGLNLYEQESGSFTVLRADSTDESSIPHDQVNVIHSDPDGTLWIGTSGGLCALDTELLRCRNFVSNAENKNTLANNNVTSMGHDSAGNLWIGTVGAFIHRMDLSSGQLQRYRVGLGTGLLDESEEGVPFGAVSGIREDAQGKLWIGTTVVGIAEWDQTRNAVSRTPGFLYMNSHKSMELSLDGTLWLGTDTGVFRVTTQPSPVRVIPITGLTVQRPVVTGIFPDETGRLFLTTDNGLYRYSESDSQIMNVKVGGNANTEYVSDALRDNSGNLWLSSFLGLYGLSPNLSRVLFQGSGIGGSFYLRDDGNIWAAAIGGLREFNPKARTVETVQRGWMQSIYESWTGNVFVGGLGGYRKYEGQLLESSRYERVDSLDTASSYDVHGIIEDRRHNVWYGNPHDKSGLNRFNAANERFEHVESPASTIYGFIEDDDENIWVSSDAGLLMIDAETEEIRSFTHLPEFGDWDVGAFGMGLYKDAAGLIYAGAVGAIYIVDPAALKSQVTSQPPTAAISELTIGDHRSDIFYLPEDNSGIEFSFDQNSFSFSFSGFDYENPQGTSVHYSLEGYDEVWHDAGDLRQARFQRVPFGHYVLKVRTQNRFGQASLEEVSLPIRVLPPWYRTTWAYLGYLLLIGLIGFRFDRWQRERILAQEKEAARERELEQAREIESAYRQLKQSKERLVQQEKLASLGSLTAGIAHEIKNPLNFVNNFAEVGVEMTQEVLDAIRSGDIEEAESILKEVMENSGQIAKHGKRADSIVRSMMQHARGGTSVHENVDVAAFLEENINLAWHGRRAKDQSFQADVLRDFAEDVGEARIQPMEMGRVILNLLNNAFDAVAGVDGGEVRVGAARDGGGLRVKVSDNGPGIPEDIREKIFEPFFTTKETGEGTGLGLSLSHDIVTKGHGGSLTVGQAIGSGAEFIITLPA